MLPLFLIEKKKCDNICFRICSMIYDNRTYAGFCRNKSLCSCHIFNKNKTKIEIIDLYRDNIIKNYILNSKKKTIN